MHYFCQFTWYFKFFVVNLHRQPINPLSVIIHSLFISLPMMVCLFWGVFFLFRCLQRNDEPRVWTLLTLFYTAATVLYFDHWLYFSGSRDNMPAAWTYIIANLSVYPIYYAYLRALTRAKRSYETAVLLSPAALATVFYPICHYAGWMSDDQFLLITRGCFAVLVLWVWIRGYQLIRNTRQRMDATYSDYRSQLLQPTHMLLVFIGITAAFSSLLNVLGRDTFSGSELVLVPAIVMSALLYSLGYVAAHTTLPQETVTQEEEEEDRATTEETDELLHKIATALREKQLYADPKLTIQDLASAVSSNRTYVSNCINRRTGLSFSQYIARYRVENAQRVLRDPNYPTDHEAVANAIALSGFASDQTFYRVFKEITGQTPIQYRKSKG